MDPDIGTDKDIEKAILERIGNKRKTLGGDHPALTDSLVSLARLYEAEGRKQEAGSLYNRILGIWEKVFVPSYGVDDFLSDLTGDLLNRGRPAHGFIEDNVLELTPELHLGTGDNRSCYEYPGKPDRCIKIEKPWNTGFNNTPRKRLKKTVMPWQADFSSNREESRFYWKKARLLGEEFYRHALHCYGVVFTNLGPGLVFERLMDHDGNYSLRLDRIAGEKPEMVDKILALMDELQSFLLQNQLYIFTSDPDNLMVQVLGKDVFRIVVIDWKTEGRANVDIPLPELFPHIARKRFCRRFREMKSTVIRIADQKKAG